MKPENWDEMTDRLRRQFASRLLSSTRGQYILGQALAVASREMKKIEGAEQETSNIEDMEVLGTMLFPMGWYLAQEKKEVPE